MTRTDNVAETLHGITLNDPYRWLEDQDSPDTRAWIKAQNEYSASVLGALPFTGLNVTWIVVAAFALLMAAGALWRIAPRSEA